MKLIIFTLILLKILQSKAYTLTVKPMPHGRFGQKELSKPTYISARSYEAFGSKSLEIQETIG